MAFIWIDFCSWVITKSTRFATRSQTVNFYHCDKTFDFFSSLFLVELCVLDFVSQRTARPQFNRSPFLVFWLLVFYRVSPASWALYRSLLVGPCNRAIVRCPLCACIRFRNRIECVIHHFNACRIQPDKIRDERTMRLECERDGRIWNSPSIRVGCSLMMWCSISWDMRPMTRDWMKNLSKNLFHRIE